MKLFSDFIADEADGSGEEAEHHEDAGSDFSDNTQDAGMEDFINDNSSETTDNSDQNTPPFQGLRQKSQEISNDYVAQPLLSQLNILAETMVLPEIDDIDWEGFDQEHGDRVQAQDQTTIQPQETQLNQDLQVRGRKRSLIQVYNENFEEDEDQSTQAQPRNSHYQGERWVRVFESQGSSTNHDLAGQERLIGDQHHGQMAEHSVINLSNNIDEIAEIPYGHATIGLMSRICGISIEQVALVMTKTQSLSDMQRLRIAPAEDTDLSCLCIACGCMDATSTRRLVETAMFLDMTPLALHAFMTLREKFRVSSSPGDQEFSTTDLTVCDNLRAEAIFFLRTGSDIFSATSPVQTARLVSDVIDTGFYFRSYFEMPALNIQALEPSRAAEDAPFVELYSMQHGSHPPPMAADQAQAPFMQWRLVMVRVATIMANALDDELAQSLRNIDHRITALQMWVDGMRMATTGYDAIQNIKSLEGSQSYSDFVDETTNKGNLLYIELVKLLAKSALSKDEKTRVVSRVLVDGRFAYAYKVKYDTVYEAIMDTHSFTRNAAIIKLRHLASSEMTLLSKTLEATNEEVLFPTIARNRQYMSFRDGVLDLKNLVFVPLRRVSAALPHNQCSCVFHDSPMSQLWDTVVNDIHPEGLIPRTHVDAERFRHRAEVLRSKQHDLNMEWRAAGAQAMATIKRIVAQDFDASDRGGDVVRRRNEFIRERMQRSEIVAQISDLRKQLFKTAKAKIERETLSLFDGNIETLETTRDFIPFAQETYMDLPTPSLDHLILYQLLETPSSEFLTMDRASDDDRAVYQVILAMLGRLFLDVRALDNWQIMPWIVGVGGSGKSCLVNLVKSCYGPGDVATMSNNVEELFGMTPMRKSYIVVGLEIGQGFKLNMKQWLSMVAGEYVRTAKKHGDAVDALWTQQMFNVGNGLPGWPDNQGQCSRRILLMRYQNSVIKQDTTIEARLTSERPAFILKAICAYHALRVKVGSSKQIWDCLPRYFLKNREHLERIMNPVASFLSNPQNCILDSDKVTPRRFFDAALKKFLSGFPNAQPPTSDDLRTVFSKYNIKVRQTAEGEELVGVFVIAD